MTTDVVITGVGVALPSGASAQELLAAALHGESAGPMWPRPDRADAPDVPGYSDQDSVTAYAMSAATAALPTSTSAPPGETGVVVASTTSNLDTIVRVAAADSYRAVRPSDVLAIAGMQVTAALSSWFDARAFTYGVCTGAAAGIDAVALAVSGVRSHRARRVMVVGTEAPGAAARRMMIEAEGERVLFTGGIALIAEHGSDEPTGGQVRIGPVVTGETIDQVAAALGPDGDRTGLVFVPAGPGRQRRAAADQLGRHYPQAAVVDLWPLLGDAQGALGVLQCVLGTAWLDQNPDQVVLAIAGSIPDRHIVSVVLGQRGCLR
jgi:3-oxoacyl-[acyl-carrier-protein] synthase II